ncbi:hypothetical protein HOY82DRAFT_579479 [Tuber indicum]|nr:hypothetical protein HOY82DRAFT_579479 [Tuber indicum]
MLVMIRMEIVNVYRRGLIRGGDMSLGADVALNHRGIYCPSELDEPMRYKLPLWIECYPPLRYNDLQHRRSLACPALHNNNNNLHIPSRPPLAGSKLSGPRTGKSRCVWSAKRAPDGVLAGRESG